MGVKAEQEIKVGDKVMVNWCAAAPEGYPGVVMRRYCEGLWEVRLASGEICIGASEMRKIQ